MLTLCRISFDFVSALEEYVLAKPSCLVGSNFDVLLFDNFSLHIKRVGKCVVLGTKAHRSGHYHLNSDLRLDLFTACLCGRARN